MWFSAAVGTFAGAGLAVEALSVARFVLAGNPLLRPLVNSVNHRPIDERTTKAQCRVHASRDRASVADVRDLLDGVLSDAGHPVREIETLSESESRPELAVRLVPAAANSDEPIMSSRSSDNPVWCCP